jgi:hypothetical protein
MKIVNIIYFDDINNLRYFWERDWLKEIFHNYDKIKYNFNKYEYEKKYENPILIVNKKNMKYINNFLDKPFMIIHLGDEYLNENIEIYENKNCIHIFRNCLRPELQNNNKITQFPLGYKQDMFQDKLSIHSMNNNNRKYIWSFCGRLNTNNRSVIINNIKSIQPNYIHTISKWNDKKSIDSYNYKKILENTLIIPCPMGNKSIDTFRLYEALECGCIPITNKYNKLLCDKKLDYHELLFGKNPIPLVDNMELELCDKINEILSSDFEKKRKDINIWYLNYKKQLIHKINEIVFTKF